MTFDFSDLASSLVNWSKIPVNDCELYGGHAIKIGCDTPHYVADAFFLSVLLFLGTFVIATGLSNAKTSSFFPTFVRNYFFFFI